MCIPLFLTCNVRSDSNPTDITSYNPQYFYIILSVLAIELIFGGLNAYNSSVYRLHFFSISGCFLRHFLIRFCLSLNLFRLLRSFSAAQGSTAGPVGGAAG
jgi:hypothetical protein